MNSSNISNSNATATASIDYLFKFLNTIDTMSRIYSVAIHVIYVWVLIFSKTLKTRKMLYSNHATIVNSFYCLIQINYTFTDHPNTGNPNIDEALCTLSEVIWVFAIYIRMYSILLIAVYRYLAVFHINLYKKLNDSLLNTVSPVILVWVISVTLPLIAKFGFNTTHGYTNCLDGYSNDLRSVIQYFAFNYLLMLIIPSVFVFFIYIKIIIKLKNMKNKINNNNNLRETASAIESIIRANHSVPVSTAVSKISNVSKANKFVHDHAIPVITVNTISAYSKGITTGTSINKQQRFANQFIFMCIIVIACGIAHSIFSSRALIPNYFVVLYYWRPVLKFYLMVVLSCIPFISMYYHPSRPKIIETIKKRLGCL